MANGVANGERGSGYSPLAIRYSTAASRWKIEREEFLGSADAPQSISSDRDEGLLRFRDGSRERCGNQQRLVDRAAHRRDPADLVDRRSDDGEVETFLAADIAVKHLADMKPEIHVGDRQAFTDPALIQGSDALPRQRRGVERGDAGAAALQ